MVRAAAGTRARARSRAQRRSALGGVFRSRLRHSPIRRRRGAVHLFPILKKGVPVKRFLLKISLFFALSAAVFVGIFGIYLYKLWKTDFKLDENITVLFVGDSHIRDGVDTSLIPNSFNSSEHGDIYFRALCRIRKFACENPNIRTIFVGVSPLSFAWGAPQVEHGQLKKILPDYAFLLTSEDVSYLRDVYSSSEIIGAFWGRPISSFSDLFYNKSLGSKLHFGNFEPQDRKWNRAFPRSSQEKMFMQMKIRSGNSFYLEKIITFCNENSLRLIFINMPLYDVESSFSQEVRENFEKMLSEDAFSKIEMWDYSNFPLPDECRLNINHINRWGAEIFSRELAERMKREGIVPADS